MSSLPGNVRAGVNCPVRALPRVIPRSGHLPEALVKRKVVSDGILPTNASILVIREVIADPAINFTEGHLLSWRRVDGIGDESGIAVSWLAILVDCCLIFAEGGIRIRGRAWGTLSAAPWRPSLRSTPKLLNSSSESELGQPIYGGEAALEVRGHRTSGFSGHVDSRFPLDGRYPA